MGRKSIEMSLRTEFHGLGLGFRLRDSESFLRVVVFGVSIFFR